MRHGGNLLRLLPFIIYIVIMFMLPAALVVITAFQDESGVFTLTNFEVFHRSGVVPAFVNSLWLSAATAAIGALFGALVCYALSGCAEGGVMHRLVDAVSTTMSQFGGVMLAFAFIATLGNQGMLTVLLRDILHVDIYAHGMWLYTPAGLILPYAFFQIPLMIITFYPAFARLPHNLPEAVATLGGGAWDYWRHVGLPLLLPSFASAFLLLFANAFSAYATAAALISQGSQLAALQVRGALIGETGLGSAGDSSALALAMLIIMTLIVTLYAATERRAAAWSQ